MSKHREIKSLVPILHDIEIGEEHWRWYASEVTSESMPYYINRFITQSLQGKAIE